MMLNGLSLSLVLILVPALVLEEYAGTLFDDGVSLLQLSKQQHRTGANVPPSMQQQVIISPRSGALKFAGRHDVVQQGGEDVVRFDAAGFEVQVRVQGATEVKVAISQEINGPGGWYADVSDEINGETEFEDGCMLSEKSGNVRSLMVDKRHGTGMLTHGSQPHHFLVYVDGVPQLKPLTKSKCHVCTFDTTEAVRGQFMEYTIATGLDPLKSHQIRIVKTSEPDFSSFPEAVPNWLALHSLILDKGFAQKPDPPRTRKIEFLGDSFMSGYCNTCGGTMCMGGEYNGSSLGGEPSDTFRWGSFALAWPHLVCEELQAECHATLLSGMSIWCNPRIRHDCNVAELPQYWERTMASDWTTKWDFKTWTPDVFVMQVSNNDHIEAPGTDKAADVAAYDKFLDVVRERYPDVQVFLVCGPFHPLWSDNSHKVELCSKVEKVAERKRDSGAKIDMLFLNVFQKDANNIKECCGHPDKDFHKLIKAKAVEEVRQIMGWHELQ